MKSERMNHPWKRGLALVLALLCLAALAACGGDPAASSPTPGQSTETPTPAPTPAPTPEPTPEVPSHLCWTKCPICGKCIDLHCEEGGECAVKCGDDWHNSFTFEAEEGVFIEGQWLPDITNLYDSTDDPFYGNDYVQGMMGNSGGGVSFTITANKDCVVNLTACTASAADKTIFTNEIAVSVNGEILSLSSSVPPGWKRTFYWTNLGCIRLKQGENVLTLTVPGTEGHGYNLDKIVLTGPDDVELTWQYTDNTHNVNDSTIESQYPGGYVTPSER